MNSRNKRRKFSISSILFQQFDPLVNNIVSGSISIEDIQSKILESIDAVRGNSGFQKDQHENELQKALESLVSDVATRRVGGEAVKNLERVKSEIQAAIGKFTLSIEADKIDFNSEYVEEISKEGNESIPNLVSEQKPHLDVENDLKEKANLLELFYKTEIVTTKPAKEPTISSEVSNSNIISKNPVTPNSSEDKKKKPSTRQPNLSNPLVSKLYKFVVSENKKNREFEQENAREKLQSLVEAIKENNSKQTKHPVEIMVRNLILNPHDVEISAHVKNFESFEDNFESFSPIDVCNVIKDVLNSIEEEEKIKTSFRFDVWHKVPEKSIKNTLAEVVMYYLQSKDQKGSLLCGTKEDNSLIAGTILNTLKPYIKYEKKFELLGEQRFRLETEITKKNLNNIQPTSNSLLKGSDSSQIWNTNPGENGDTHMNKKLKVSVELDLELITDKRSTFTMRR